MSNSFEQLKYRFNSANAVEKIIGINLLIFVLTYLINTLSFLFNLPSNLFIDWFALPSQLESFIFKPWTIISYGFLHSGFLHIFFNLLFLYYIGRVFLDFFSTKQFWLYYFSGIFFGGLLYLLSYNFLPALKDQDAILVGASAGVIAILVGIASLVPQYALHFRFIGPVKLVYIAIIFVLLDIMQLPVDNSGGRLAHLGGAVLGFVLTKYFNKGESIINTINQWFKPKKKTPFKTVYKNKTVNKTVTKDQHQQKIDAILDKISKSGYDTLTQAEKDFLFKAGKE